MSKRKIAVLYAYIMLSERQEKCPTLGREKLMQALCELWEFVKYDFSRSTI